MYNQLYEKFDTFLTCQSELNTHTIHFYTAYIIHTAIEKFSILLAYSNFGAMRSLCD